MAENGAKSLIFVNRSGLSKYESQMTVRDHGCLDQPPYWRHGIRQILKHSLNCSLVGYVTSSCGIGREVALWMAENGAKSLIFVNRSGLSKYESQMPGSAPVLEARNKTDPEAFVELQSRRICHKLVWLYWEGSSLVDGGKWSKEPDFRKSKRAFKI
jgi:hypothetical protein